MMGCRCFEILGVDVMLDGKRKPYLIEVNHLPSFTCDSPLDEDIKRRLIDQTLDLTCGSLTAEDRKAYEQLARERRDGLAATRAAGEKVVRDTTTAVSTLAPVAGDNQDGAASREMTTSNVVDDS